MLSAKVVKTEENLYEMYNLFRSPREVFKLLWGILVNINTSRLIEHQTFWAL